MAKSVCFTIHVQICVTELYPSYIHMQLWAHAYHQVFDADININITESINNAVRSRYLKIRPDALAFSLTEALLEVAFPAMEKRYIQATVEQMESYRKSRYQIPEYLLNWPHTVQGECRVNQEKAKAITNDTQHTTGRGLPCIWKPQPFPKIWLPGQC